MKAVSLFLYRAGLHIYRFGISVASVGNEKARKWIEGRQNVLSDLKKQLDPDKKRIWIHISSLGEYEQGAPLLKALQEQYPGYQFVVSFFSPSGYEVVRKKDINAVVTYLPLDSWTNAARFIDIVQPEMTVFIKYEYWYFYIDELYRRGIPILLVSAIFRPSQPFFKWYGALFRKMLRRFNHIFVQDESSGSLLKGIGIHHFTVSGDTRFDRVAEIARMARSFPGIEAFISNQPVLVAGSTWPEDEKLLLPALKKLNTKAVIAPHEIHEAHLRDVEQRAGKQTVRYSKLMQEGSDTGADILIIDNVGMLSSLYRYATVAYVGGGFGAGLHNILEPAVYGVPVIVGPNYGKFKEAVDLVSLNGALVVQDEMELTVKLQKVLHDKTLHKNSGAIVHDYVQKNRGAVKRVMNYITEALVQPGL